MFWWQEDAGDGVRVAFTDRAAGNLALHTGDDPRTVRARRAALERVMGVPRGTLLFLDQVHGTDVVDADAADRPQVPRADAAVSAGATPLAVMVADCVPVLLAGTSPAGPVTGVAHAGRRGLLEGVLEATVDRLRARGAERLRAWIGPAVCGACYEVPAAMQADALRHLPAAAATTRHGTPALDLPAGARDVLGRLGVAVRTPRGGPGPACTLENEGLSSHRRDPASGRIAGLVWRSAAGERAA
ncbi:polyphenol oxidase family protein [Kocuria flava]|uniref:polyphenol oxidase family protein n=1 Tax=Kocuria flava TaxID=446860 RepID=UPI001FF2F0C8|nr:polyphenol oxidase family protein [Kocuria flava]MCJ8505839.1 polyphenol oxidase family protein [Kocuria flava]